MENQTSNPGEQSADDLKPNVQETIFEGQEFSLEGYDKSIKNARIALFVVGGVQLIAGIVVGSIQGGDIAMYSIIVAVVVAAIFIGLGFWTKSKPYTAILIGLILYVALVLLDVVIDPSSIGKGIILKVLVIVYLAKSLGDAKEAQEMKKNFDNR
ncbi:MAG: hypothetical protein ABIX01_12695 [Chitinophagaceae bacterium]